MRTLQEEKGRRGVDGPVGRSILRRMLRSVATVAKITLVCLNIWVLAVVLVVSLAMRPYVIAISRMTSGWGSRGKESIRVVRAKATDHHEESRLSITTEASIHRYKGNSPWPSVEAGSDTNKVRQDLRQHYLGPVTELPCPGATCMSGIPSPGQFSRPLPSGSHL
ncbi:hypothetical protein ElyMa_006377700 [Elysia marginata]|uniref:G-protein coupled receptors family 1 profile domain-containing protein n=1 Tax=Elysia marginata TaxID=1093978 RepID=A0AAV4HSA4_9GAST|nr:hypothetical protein ElyMa_006377700 [Elysia marginata]